MKRMRKSDVDLSSVLGGGRPTPPVLLTSAIYNASGPRTGTSSAMSKIASSGSGGLLEIASCAACAFKLVKLQPCAFWMTGTLDHLEAHRFLQ